MRSPRFFDAAAWRTPACHDGCAITCVLQVQNGGFGVYHVDDRQGENGRYAAFWLPEADLRALVADPSALAAKRDELAQAIHGA